MKATTLILPELSEKDKFRFWSKVDKNGPVMPGQKDRCWVWTGLKLPRGYGKFSVGPTTLLAHRLALILGGGVLTDEKPQVNHKCSNPPCCNPDHLYSGSHQDNMNDRESDGKTVRGDQHGKRTKPEANPRGEKHVNSKLSDAQCEYVRNSSLSHAALGRELGVSDVQIGNIRRGVSRRPYVPWH